MNPFTGQKLLRTVESTILHRQLCSVGDKILIGISGGKDSLALLDCLSRLGFSNLHSLHIRIDQSSPLPFESFCRERSSFSVIETEILSQVQNSRRKNACYMCSRAKRKALVEYAVANDFNLLALAHHADDAIETLLLNLFFQREISTMMPAQNLFRGKLRLIRPFYDAWEKDIRRYAKALNLPISDWSCGYETDNRRTWVKAQLHLWQKSQPGINLKQNIHCAMQNVNPDFLPARPTIEKA